MKKKYTYTYAVLLLFAVLFSLVLVLISNFPKYNVVKLESSQNVAELSPNDKVKFSVDSGSDGKIDVLIKTNDLDKAYAAASSKGTAKKHKVGHVISAEIPENQLDSLANDNSISEILPNRVVKAFSIEVSETNAETFWNQGFTGKNVVVAVLDTGVNSDKVISSADFTDTTINDENGHGTKIAEIILAMAPDAKIINAKVLDKDGLGSEASVISGINYAVEQKADIISLSLGGLFDDINSPLVAAVEDAISRGITVVVAAGNCGKQGLCGDFTGIATPGNAPNAITVGSVDGVNAVDYSAGKDFGNYIKPDVVAPVSANSLTGTSASTPFVSGAVALMIEKYKYNPLKIKSLIEHNAIDLGITAFVIGIL